MTPREHAKHASASCDHLARGICRKCCAHFIQAALQEERVATTNKLKRAVRYFMGEYGQWSNGMDIMMDILQDQKKKMKKES